MDHRKPTNRYPDGKLVTSGKPKFEFARFSKTGKVHLIKSVIFRWNFMGGTPDKPNVTFVSECGPQRSMGGLIVVQDPAVSELCLRCDNKRHRVYGRRPDGSSYLKRHG